jgi:hypothetical protein
VGPRVGLDTEAREKNPFPPPGIEPRSVIVVEDPKLCDTIWSEGLVKITENVRQDIKPLG